MVLVHLSEPLPSGTCELLWSPGRLGFVLKGESGFLVATDGTVVRG